MGVRKRTSSAYYPQSNGRAELTVKTAKRILAGNTDNCGRLCHDHAARALLTHHNTPVQDLSMSSAVMLLRTIKDHLPVLREKYQIRKQWKEIRALREVSMVKRHLQNEQFYNKHSRPLRKLQVGDFVHTQNQDGYYPRRWTKTRRVVETCGNRQYRVRVGGSNRVMLRNRCFLCKIYPVVDGPRWCTPKIMTPAVDLEPLEQRPPDDINVTPPSAENEPEEEEMEVDNATDATEDNTEHLVERLPSRQPSRRMVQPPRNLSPQMRGQSHGNSDV